MTHFAARARSRGRLPPHVERELVLAAANGGDEEARDQLVDAFLPLIASVARGYRSYRSVDRRELMQEGVVGLLTALDRYDTRLGTPFWAYASWWVREAMQGLVAELTRPVVLSDRALRQLARVRVARRELTEAEGHEPRIAAIATRAELSREQVERLVSVERSPRSLEEPIGGDDVGDATVGDFVADPVAEDDYERVERRIDLERLHLIPDELCDRERAILSARYGLGRPAMTLREIADGLDLSAERVRQIQERALGKLRDGAAVSG